MGSLANAVSITAIGAIFDVTGTFTIQILGLACIALLNGVLLWVICKLGNRNRTLEDC